MTCRIVLTSFLLAIKFSSDIPYRMAEIAKIGGIPKVELIILEQVFCDITEFKLAVDSETYNKYIAALRKYAFHF